MKLVILAGSIRKDRKSIQVCHYLQSQLTDLGATVDLVDPYATPLPIFDDSADQDPAVYQAVLAFRDRLEKADAMIFVTPEYNGSFSGVLKNTLDYFWAEFAKKPIGVAAVSSGRMGGINASTQLQHVILSLGAYPLPVKLLVPDVENTFDAHSDPVNADFVRSAWKFIKEFMWFAAALVKARESQLQEEVKG